MAIFIKGRDDNLIDMSSEDNEVKDLIDLKSYLAIKIPISSIIVGQFYLELQKQSGFKLGRQ